MSSDHTEIPTLEHQASGRTWTALLVVLGVWVALLVLWIFWQAATWIILVLMAVTLPAVWDFLTARPAWLRLDDQQIQWRSGRQEGQVLLERLDHVRFETRLDLSVRVRLVLHGGKRITVPQDALPKPPALQLAFDARDIKTQRHHFGLL